MFYNYIGYYNDLINISYEELDSDAKKRLNVLNHVFQKIKIFEPEIFLAINDTSRDIDTTEEEIASGLFSRSYIDIEYNNYITCKTFLYKFLRDKIITRHQFYGIPIYTCYCPDIRDYPDECECSIYDFCNHYNCNCFLSQPIFQNIIRHISDEDIRIWYESG